MSSYIKNLITCIQVTVPTEKSNVPTISSPSLYADLNMQNLPTFPRVLVIMYEFGLLLAVKFCN